MRPVYAQKNHAQLEQGNVAAADDVAVSFLSFLHCSAAAFLLASQTFSPCFITRHLSLFCVSYSRLLGGIPKDFQETFRMSLMPNITVKRQRLKVVENFASQISLWPTQQECVESERHLGGNQNQGIQSCWSYHPPLW